MTGERPRYVVSNLGFGWAVQDTGERLPYERPAKTDTTELSSNPRNAEILEIFPTRAQAQAHADELEARRGEGRARAG